MPNSRDNQLILGLGRIPECNLLLSAFWRMLLTPRREARIERPQGSVTVGPGVEGDG